MLLELARWEDQPKRYSKVLVTREGSATGVSFLAEGTGRAFLRTSSRKEGSP